MFAAAMGMLWMGVMPLTSGLVAEMFGTRYMATLLGISFMVHQAGSFLGAWGGGLIYDAMGSYDRAWQIGVHGRRAGGRRADPRRRPRDGGATAAWRSPRSRPASLCGLRWDVHFPPYPARRRSGSPRAGNSHAGRLSRVDVTFA